VPVTVPGQSRMLAGRRDAKFICYLARRLAKTWHEGCSLRIVTDRTRHLLDTLERLLELSGAEQEVALAAASDLVATALQADKVDVFMYDEERDTLSALGSSHQPLSALQKRHGLDVLPLANGGRVVHIFNTAQPFVNGEVERDPEELRGIKETLAIRTQLGVPLHVGQELRGVLLVASQKPNFWTQNDLPFAESVARWIGIVAHRAELSAETSRNAVEQGRRAVAEELVTVLAHDLRNYLAPLDLRIRSMRRRAEREERREDLRDFDLTLKGLSRLGSLVSDLLDVARVDQGIFCIEAQPVPLLALLEETAATLETTEHPIVVQAVEDLTIVADPMRIRQCLENVIGNAIKHSPKSGKVYVTSSRVQKESGSWAAIDIRDEGPGIAEHVLPHIFERYVKGGPRAGLGIGLYLAKRIVLLHRGELSVESKIGQGARFRVTLPCYEAER
jgi:two-component system OmpR family sensor kinase